MVVGAAIVLIGEELGKQPMRLAPVIAEKKITVWYSTPSILRLLTEFGYEGKAAKHGPWKAWHSNGQLQTEGQYENDTPIGRFTCSA